MSNTFLIIISIYVCRSHHCSYRIRNYVQELKESMSVVNSAPPCAVLLDRLRLYSADCLWQHCSQRLAEIHLKQYSYLYLRNFSIDWIRKPREPHSFHPLFGLVLAVIQECWRLVDLFRSHMIGCYQGHQIVSAARVYWAVFGNSQTIDGVVPLDFLFSTWFFGFETISSPMV